MAFRSIPFLMLAICLIVTSDLLAQSNEPASCNDLEVQTTTTLQAGGKYKVTLTFGQRLDYRDFSMFLFAKNRRNNKQEFSSNEIIDLPKGEYVLIVQSKQESSLCTKQVKLKLP
jgi:hypothetical protein